jgi:hypothetical protein
MYFTKCYYNYDFRTIYVWNEIYLVLHPLYYNKKSITLNTYYILQQLYILIIAYHRQIPLCDLTGLPILTINPIHPVCIYSENLFLHLYWNTFPFFE